VEFFKISGTRCVLLLLLLLLLHGSSRGKDVTGMHKWMLLPVLLRSILHQHQVDDCQSGPPCLAR
jgi:hypothetical protein